VLTRADSGVFTGPQPFDAYPEGATISLGGGITGKVTYLANWTGSQATSTLTGGNDMAIFNVVVPEPASATLLLVALVLFALMRAKQRVAHPLGYERIRARARDRGVCLQYANHPSHGFCDQYDDARAAS